MGGGRERERNKMKVCGDSDAEGVKMFATREAWCKMLRISDGRDEMRLIL